MKRDITIESVDRLLVSHQRTTEKTDSALRIHNNAYKLTLFISGNVDYLINDLIYHLKPGDLIFVRPQEIHGSIILDEQPFERIVIHMEESFAASLSTSITDLLEPFYISRKESLCALSLGQVRDFEMYTKMIISSLANRDFGFDIKVRSSLSLLLLLVNSACEAERLFDNNTFPQIIRDTLAYINQNLNQELSVPNIADAMNVSRSHISHLFREYTGNTIWDYIITRRIQYARALLRHGTSITATCYECGFQDYAHFAKVFTKLNGISPGKYAKDFLYECRDSSVYWNPSSGHPFENR